EGIHLEVAHDEERQPDQDDRGLQRRQAAFAREHQQRRGDQRDRHAPEDALPQRVVVLVAVGHGVGDQGRGVHRGHEEDDHQDDRDHRDDERRRVVLEEDEQCTGHVPVVDDPLHEPAIPVQLDVHGGQAEDTEPDHREAGRNGQHAGDELADGAALGDAGDEDAHEGGPGDGPGPVEDGPGVLPAGVGEAVVPQRELGQGDEVVAEGLQGPLEDEQGGAAGDQHEQQQQHGHDDVEVGEDLDALLQAEGHGDQRQPADHADDDEVPDRVLRDPEQLVQAAVDLQGAQTHRDRDAEDGADDRDDVDDLADRPVDALAEQRLEDRAHARGQV